jgi:tetratricopeptide (TPR) repeat protein
MINLHLDVDILSLPEAEAKKKIDDINMVAQHFHNMGYHEWCTYCSENALSMAEKIKYTKGIADSKNNIGNTYYRTSKFAEGIEYLLQSAEIYNKLGDAKNEAKTYINLGICYRNLDDYATLASLGFKALNISREIGDEHSEGQLLNQVGNYYLEVMQLDLAEEYYLMALKVWRKHKNITYIVLVLYNLGLLSFNRKDYKKALKFYNAALDFNRKIEKSNFYENRILRNIAMVYNFLERYEEAEKIYLDTLAYFVKQKDNIEISESLSDLAFVYTKMNRFEEAEKKFKEAERLANELNSKRLLHTNDWKFAELYIKRNDYKNALYYSRRYASLDFERNKTISDEHIRKLNILHKVDITKKETQILADKNEELKKINEELIKLNNDKNFFMNLSAVDLKIPLERITSIIGDINMPETEKINMQKQLHKILDYTSQMEKIMSDLLQKYELETAK